MLSPISLSLLTPVSKSPSPIFSQISRHHSINQPSPIRSRGIIVWPLLIDNFYLEQRTSPAARKMTQLRVPSSDLHQTTESPCSETTRSSSRQAPRRGTQRARCPYKSICQRPSRLWQQRRQQRECIRTSCPHNAPRGQSTTSPSPGRLTIRGTEDMVQGVLEARKTLLSSGDRDLYQIKENPSEIPY